MECSVVITGGYKNHVHILCLLSKKIALMNLIKELKARSSKWMKTKDTRLKDFNWQNGYGAFSIDYRHLENTVLYIKNQKTHHQKKTFEEEFITLLHEYNVEYNEQFLWD